MAVEKVQKITIMGLKNCKDKFLEEIQKKSLLHLKEEKESLTPINDISDYHFFKKLSSIINFFEQQVSESFFEKNKIQYIDEKNFFEDQKKELEQSKVKIDEIYQYIENINNLEKNIEHIEHIYSELLPWSNFTIPFNKLNHSNYYEVILMKLNSTQIQLLDNADISSSIDYEIINEQQADKPYYACVVYISKQNFTQVIDFIKMIDLEIFIPNKSLQELSLKEECQVLSDKINKLKQEIAENKNSLEQQFSRIAEMRLLYDYFQNLYNREYYSQNTQETNFIFHLEAFIATKDIPILKQVIRFSNFAIDFEEISLNENEEAPVLIRNKSFAKNFEFVTGMYSMPGKEDPDPTPFLAPFFAIFMGMCIGDAGYGLVLSIISCFFSKKIRIDESMKQLLNIIFYAGIMSIVMGIVTGTYFAIPFDKMGISVPHLYDPAKDIMLALEVAISFGFIHITLGYLVKAMFLWKQGQYIDAFLDGVTRALIMLGGLLLVIGLSNSLPVLALIGKYTAIGSVVIILFTGGRNTGDSVVSKFMWGFYEVYSLTGIFGDLLSYARLFALALSGGIIGNALNTLTPGLISNISFNGVTDIIISTLLIIVCIFILVFGHMFVMTLSILSAFIHTMRLQFVEFFTKFFTGGGSAFEAFGIKSNYYWIKKNINK